MVTGQNRRVTVETLMFTHMEPINAVVIYRKNRLPISELRITNNKITLVVGGYIK